MRSSKYEVVGWWLPDRHRYQSGLAIAILFVQCIEKCQGTSHDGNGPFLLEEQVSRSQKRIDSEVHTLHVNFVFERLKSGQQC